MCGGRAGGASAGGRRGLTRETDRERRSARRQGLPQHHGAWRLLTGTILRGGSPGPAQRHPPPTTSYPPTPADCTHTCLSTSAQPVTPPRQEPGAPHGPEEILPRGPAPHPHCWAMGQDHLPTSHPASCCARLCPPPPRGPWQAQGRWMDGLHSALRRRPKGQGCTPDTNLHPHPHGTSNHVTKSPTQGFTPDQLGGGGHGAHLRMP